MKRTLTALATALGLTFVVAASAFAWQDRTAGRPMSLSAGSTAGVYFWHNNPVGLSLRTTDPPGVQHYYTGTIISDGTFFNVNPVQLEGGDWASVDPSGHVLTFSFHTFSGIDGVDYEILGGSGQRVNLQMDGAEFNPSSVFLGSYSVHPEFMPFTVCRTDGGSCGAALP